MANGIQVVAPQGYKTLKKGVSYHLLRSDPILLRVILVSFHDKSKYARRRYELAILSRDDYEKGLVPDNPGKVAPIKPVQSPPKLPPWLSDLEKHNDLDSIPALNTPTKRRDISHADDVDKRTGIIHSAVKQIDEVLKAKDPDIVLNRLARACRPSAQNETRFRLWFFCYVAFGYNRWALLPPLSEWGKWDRSDPEHQNTKYGRPAGHLGRQFGSGLNPDMLKKCIEGFRKYVKLADNFTEVYALTMIGTFGCFVRKPVLGKKEFIHPNGEPFPSFEQFRYHVRKTIGKAEVRRVMLGEQRTRSEDDPVVGSFAESLSNIGESAHFDSRVNWEHPKGYLIDEPLPKLNVVELIDGVSGRCDGVGFSLGSETAQAYKSALFCAAISKSKFGQIIGLPISEDDWYGKGLPVSLTRDRGPGASEEVRAAVAQWNIQLAMPPSYTPQSNSTVESKHRRRKRRTGAPEYVVSKHTVIDMVKRETQRVISRNKKDSALARASDVAVVRDDVKTPDEFWRYLFDRHRTDLINISFEDAVRTFLQPIEFTVDKGRLYYRHRVYRAPELMESGFARAMRYMQGVKVKGFCFPMVMRTMWVNVQGRLVEVYAQMSHQEDDTELWVCHEEFEIGSARRSKASGARQAQKPIETAGCFQDFKEATGKDWHVGTTRAGRAKAKTKKAMREVALIKG